jgi:hypothetical protein
MMYSRNLLKRKSLLASNEDPVSLASRTSPLASFLLIDRSPSTKSSKLISKEDLVFTISLNTCSRSKVTTKTIVNLALTSLKNEITC